MIASAMAAVTALLDFLRNIFFKSGSAVGVVAEAEGSTALDSAKEEARQERL